MSLLLKRDTSDNWYTGNPVLGPGEPGFEIDTLSLKIGGTGTTHWNDLPYIGDADDVWEIGSNSSDYSVQTKGTGCFAASTYVVAEGFSTSGTGVKSHSEGSYTYTFGNSSHAEGISTVAGYRSLFPPVDVGSASHSEGYYTYAWNDYSHAEGSCTTASGVTSHSEGSGTTAIGDYSHAEGYGTIAEGNCSHSEGTYNESMGSSSHAEGNNNTSIGKYSHVEGEYNIASGTSSHVGGWSCTDTGNISFIHSYKSNCYHDYSAILGGTGITSLANNTVYVPQLEIAYGTKTSIIMTDVALGTRYKVYVSGGTLKCESV